MELARLFVYGGIAVVAIGAYVWSNQKPPPLEAKKTVLHKPKLKEVSDYDATDFAAKFDKPKVKLRNLFMPLVLSPEQQTANAPTAKKEDITRIPANFAGGDPNWQYTGFCIVDGQRMALLENPVKKEAGYVKEGETWKKSRIRLINSANLVIADADGQEEVVLRYTSFVKPTQDGAVPPVDLGSALRGPINPNSIGILPSPPGRIIRMMPGVQP